MNCTRRKTGVSLVMADRHLACRGITVAAAPTGSPRDESVRLADWKPVGHDSRDGRLPRARNRRKNHEQTGTGS